MSRVLASQSIYTCARTYPVQSCGQYIRRGCNNSTWSSEWRPHFGRERQLSHDFEWLWHGATSKSRKDRIRQVTGNSSGSGCGQILSDRTSLRPMFGRFSESITGNLKSDREIISQPTTPKMIILNHFNRQRRYWTHYPIIDIQQKSFCQKSDITGLLMG